MPCAISRTQSSDGDGSERIRFCIDLLLRPQTSLSLNASCKWSPLNAQREARRQSSAKKEYHNRGARDCQFILARKCGYSISGQGHSGCQGLW